MAVFLQINGLPMPTPSAYSVSRKDLMSSAERSASGYLQKVKIRTIYQIDCEWNYLDQVSINKIIKEVEDDVQVRFVDIDGEFKEITAYVDDRTGKIYHVENDQLKLSVNWKEFRLTFTEI